VPVLQLFLAVPLLHHWLLIIWLLQAVAVAVIMIVTNLLVVVVLAVFEAQSQHQVVHLELLNQH
jgi:hypothetical protein